MRDGIRRQSPTGAISVVWLILFAFTGGCRKETDASAHYDLRASAALHDCEPAPDGGSVIRLMVDRGKREWCLSHSPGMTLSDLVREAPPEVRRSDLKGLVVNGQEVDFPLSEANARRALSASDVVMAVHRGSRPHRSAPVLFDCVSPGGATSLTLQNLAILAEQRSISTVISAAATATPGRCSLRRHIFAAGGSRPPMGGLVENASFAVAIGGSDRLGLSSSVRVCGDVYRSVDVKVATGHAGGDAAAATMLELMRPTWATALLVRSAGEMVLLEDLGHSQMAPGDTLIGIPATTECTDYIAPATPSNGPLSP